MWSNAFSILFDVPQLLLMDLSPETSGLLPTDYNQLVELITQAPSSTPVKKDALVEMKNQSQLIDFIGRIPDDALNFLGARLLIFAVLYDNEAMIRKLLARGVDPNQSPIFGDNVLDSLKEQPLYALAAAIWRQKEHAQLTICHLLLEGVASGRGWMRADPNLTIAGPSLLDYACFSGKPLLELFHRFGGNVQRVDDENHTIVTRVISSLGESLEDNVNTEFVVEVVGTVLRLGARNVINHVHEGMTALSYALEAQSEELCRLLLENGAETDVCGQYESLLCSAIQIDSWKLFCLLYQYGADVNRQYGKTNPESAYDMALNYATTDPRYFTRLYAADNPDHRRLCIQYVLNNDSPGLLQVLVTQGVSLPLDDLFASMGDDLSRYPRVRCYIQALNRAHLTYYRKGMFKANTEVEQRFRDELFAAIKQNNKASCQQCLQAGYDLNFFDETYGVPLLVALDYALGFGSSEIVKLLLDKGANPRWQLLNLHINVATPHWLMRAAHVKIRQRFSDGKPKTKKGQKDYEQLIQTLDQRMCELMSLLIKAGALVEGSVENQEFVKTLDTFTPGSVVLVDFNQPGTHPTGYPLLSYAILYGFEKLCALLLDQGVNPNFALNGQLPLTVAVSQCELSMVRQLLARGAQPQTELLASVHQRLKCSAKLPIEVAVSGSQTELALLLLAHGADPNHYVSSENSTLLTISIRSNNLKILEALLAHGADPNHQKNQVPPLWLAASLGYWWLVDALLAHKACLSAHPADKPDIHPIHFAARARLPVYVVLLADCSIEAHRMILEEFVKAKDTPAMLRSRIRDKLRAQQADVSTTVSNPSASADSEQDLDTLVAEINGGQSQKNKQERSSHPKKNQPPEYKSDNKPRGKQNKRSRLPKVPAFSQENPPVQTPQPKQLASVQMHALQQLMQAPTSSEVPQPVVVRSVQVDPAEHTVPTAVPNQQVIEEASPAVGETVVLQAAAIDPAENVLPTAVSNQQVVEEASPAVGETVVLQAVAIDPAENTVPAAVPNQQVVEEASPAMSGLGRTKRMVTDCQSMVDVALEATKQVVAKHQEAVPVSTQPSGGDGVEAVEILVTPMETPSAEVVVPLPLQLAVQELLSRNLLDPSLLVPAATNSQFATVYAIVSAHAQHCRALPDGPEAFIYAASGGYLFDRIFSAHLIRTMLAGYGVLQQHKNGMPLLHRAVSSRSLLLISVCLFYGAKIFARDDEGMTALMLAAKHNFVDVIGILLSYLAYHDHEILSIEACLESLNLALSAGSTEAFDSMVNIFDSDYYPLFDLLTGAYQRQQVTLCEKLLKLSQNRDGKKGDFLFSAIARGNVDLCQYLIPHYGCQALRQLELRVFEKVRQAIRANDLESEACSRRILGLLNQAGLKSLEQRPLRHPGLFQPVLPQSPSHHSAGSSEQVSRAQAPS